MSFQVKPAVRKAPNAASAATDSARSGSERSQDGARDGGSAGNQNTVFVGGITQDHTQEDVRKHFEQFGAVKEVQVNYHPLSDADSRRQMPPANQRIRLYMRLSRKMALLATQHDP